MDIMNGYLPKLLGLFFQQALQLLEHTLLRDRANHAPGIVVDNRIRDAADHEFLRKFLEFHGFDTLGKYHRGIFHGDLVSEHHGPRAVRSGGRDKDLQVQGLGQAFDIFTQLRRKTRVAA